MDAGVAFGSSAAAIPFVISGNSTLNGDVPAGQVIAVRAPYGTTAKLTTAGEMTNNGTVVLDATGRYAQSVLDASAGTFHNVGVLRTALGSADCCQNGRTILGTIDNTGAIDSQLDTHLTGTLVNKGTVTVAPGGTLHLDGSTALQQVSGAIGVPDSAALVLHGGPVSATAGTVTGVLQVESGSLSFSPGSTVVGRFLTRGNTALTGDVPSGVTVEARAAYGSTATLAPTASFTNRGTVLLSNEGRYSNATVDLGSKTLTNNGTLRAQLAPADCCSTEAVSGHVLNNGTIAGNGDFSLSDLDNQGTVAVEGGAVTLNSLANWDGATSTLTGGSYEVGTGTLRLGSAPIQHLAASLRLIPGASLTTLSSADSLGSLQDNSGVLTLASGRTLATPGAFANTGSVEVADGSVLNVLGSYSQSGEDAATTVHGSKPGVGVDAPAVPSQLTASTVALNGGRLMGDAVVAADVMNSGGTVAPGTDAVGALKVQGTYTQAAGGTTQLHFTSAALRDQLAVSGAVGLAGALDLVPSASYSPLGSDVASVITGSSRSGTFSSVAGNALVAGWILEPEYGASGVALVVTEHVAPTNPTVTSGTHTVNGWSKTPVVRLTVSGASDNLSGVVGYSYEWSSAATTTPDTTSDAASLTTVTSPSFADGDHWFHIRTLDGEGNWSSAAHVGPFRIDRTAPKAPTLTAPSATTTAVTTWSTSTKAPTLAVGWTGATDATSGVAGYSVVYRSAPASTAVFGTPVTTAQQTGTVWSAKPAAGVTFCLRIKVVDKAGNSTLGPERCVSTPIDSASLIGSVDSAKKAQWATVASTAAYLGSVRSSTLANATLKTGVVKIKRLALVAQKCTGCGSVQVLLGTTNLGTFSLNGSGSKVVIPVKTWSTTQTGVVTIKQVSAGKAVKIDGLVAGAS